MVNNKKGIPDFAKIKKEVSFKQVLARYGLLDKLKSNSNSDQLTGPCPIHQGDGKSSFSVSLKRNCFNCFSCKAHGNILDFAAAMEGNITLKEAGDLLSDWFGVPLQAGRLERKGAQVGEPVGRTAQADKATQDKETLVRERKEEGTVSSTSSKVINPPLTFELKKLDQEHPYLKGRGLTPETIKFFGLGFCLRGLMKNRIVIPIHNEKGELVAYAGRAVDAQGEKEGKYKLPPKFQKSAVVYNLHRVKPLVREGKELIFVEGYFSLFKLWQAGFPNTVALMGSQMSERQEELIVETVGAEGKVVLLFDNDKAGLACTEDVLRRLSRRFFVKVASLPQGVQQPDQMDGAGIKALFS